MFCSGSLTFLGTYYEHLWVECPRKFCYVSGWNFGVVSRSIRDRPGKRHSNARYTTLRSITSCALVFIAFPHLQEAAPIKFNLYIAIICQVVLYCTLSLDIASVPGAHDTWPVALSLRSVRSQHTLHPLHHRDNEKKENLLPDISGAFVACSVLCLQRAVS